MSRESDLQRPQRPAGKSVVVLPSVHFVKMLAACPCKFAFFRAGAHGHTVHHLNVFTHTAFV